MKREKRCRQASAVCNTLSIAAAALSITLFIAGAINAVPESILAGYILLLAAAALCGAGAGIFLLSAVLEQNRQSRNVNPAEHTAPTQPESKERR